jgi:hypothetical protein
MDKAKNTMLFVLAATTAPCQLTTNQLLPFVSLSLSSLCLPSIETTPMKTIIQARLYQQQQRKE